MTVRQLIQQNRDIEFLVGNQGAFDKMVLSVLRVCKKEHPQITYSVVLAYFPENSEESVYDQMETIYPEGLERVPKRFAIARRNEWLLKESDTVIAYVNYQSNGAGTYVEKARKKGKRVINLAEMINSKREEEATT